MRKNSSATSTHKSRRNSRNAGVIIIMAVIWLILVCVATLVIDRRQPVVRLKGNQTITLEFGDSYTDPGAEATTAGVIFGDIALPMELKTTGTVNTNELGTYTVTYQAALLWADAIAERTVIIRDTTAPEIILRGESVATWLNGYTEEGFSATDLHDGDITDRIIREETASQIVYSVTDSSGNTATAVRPLTYSSAAPEILLNGESEESIVCTTKYTDPGAQALDNTGADLSSLIVTEGSVDPLTPGDYTIAYSITNSSGESVRVSRTVHVTAVPLPPTGNPSNKTIYLTFDDGPGPYTAELLSVLKKYGVKATFFVTNCNSDYAYLIAREAKEGHTVALHTYCHEYETIYASDEAFYDDFFAMQEVIYRQTGSYTQQFRFPGGSSNTVSRVCKGIMSRLTTALPNMGYVYYDWNVDSKDAGGAKTADEVFKNVSEGCKDYNYCIVLQHDIKGFSVDAVDDIIRWGKANGYTFSALQLDSPQAHHGLNN